MGKAETLKLVMSIHQHKHEKAKKRVGRRHGYLYQLEHTLQIDEFCKECNQYHEFSGDDLTVRENYAIEKAKTIAKVHNVEVIIKRKKCQYSHIPSKRHRGYPVGTYQPPETKIPLGKEWQEFARVSMVDGKIKVDKLDK